MGVQALFQVGLGLLGVSAILQAVMLATISGFGTAANLPPGGRGVAAFVLALLQVLALFVAGYALILHNDRIARTIVRRSGIADAPISGVPDLRTVLIALFGVSLLVRALPVVVSAIGGVLNLRPQVVTYPLMTYPSQVVIATGLQVAVGLFLILRPARVLELWTPGPPA